MRRDARPVLSFAAFAIIGACARTASRRAPSDSATAERGDAGVRPLASAGPREDAGAPTSAPAPKLDAHAPFADLAVDGFGAAIVSLPLGTTAPRPIVIATHGNYDRPEWQCEVWRGIVVDRAFVLCPRGIERTDVPKADAPRFMYSTNEVLEREIDAGVAALRARYGGFVDPGSLLYTGFSQGALMGVAIVARNPSRYARAVLVEGGGARFNPGVVRTYAGGGGERVLFACGQPGCNAEAKHASAELERAGVAARVVYAKGLGHRYDDAVADAVAGAFAWLIEGDSRWAAP